MTFSLISHTLLFPFNENLELSFFPLCFVFILIQTSHYLAKILICLS